MNWLSDEDYWKLQYRFDGPYQPPTDPHPLLGWVGAFSRDSYIHDSVAEIRDRRLVLLYGDSLRKCVWGVLCFEDILNGDPEFAQHHYLLNYGGGGYVVDQIYLLMQNSVRLYRDPFKVVVSPRSSRSNLPLKVLQYLSAGCAIVATAIDAHRTILTDELAVLTEPKSSSALASAISGLLKNPAKVAELESAARQYADQNLGWSKFVRLIGSLSPPARAAGGKRSATYLPRAF